MSADGTENDRRLRLSGYMVLAGLIISVAGYYDWKNTGDLLVSFMGFWILFCGVVAFFLGPSWFAEQVRPTDGYELKFDQGATKVFVVTLVFAVWTALGLVGSWFHNGVNWPAALLFGAAATTACFFIGYLEGDKTLTPSTKLGVFRDSRSVLYTRPMLIVCQPA